MGVLDCAVCAAIEERIAAWTLLPVHNGEGMQVLRYGPGQRYDAHWVSWLSCWLALSSGQLLGHAGTGQKHYF